MCSLRHVPNDVVRTLKAGESLIDKTYSEYIVLAVDRPFRATLKMRIEDLCSCSWWYWGQCAGRVVIVRETSARICHSLNS